MHKFSLDQFWVSLVGNSIIELGKYNYLKSHFSYGDFFPFFHNFFSALSIDQGYTLIKSQKKLGTYLLQKWTTKGMQVRAN